MSIKYNECVSVFLPESSGMQIAPFLLSIIFSSMTTLSLPLSFTLSHEWHNFFKKMFERKMCVLIISATFF
jgi:hypothetical protein